MDSASAGRGMNSLERLERAVAACLLDLPRVRASGIVTEVNPGFYRVSGLSPFLRLGDCIAFEDGQLGETIRVDERSASVKAFNANASIGLGERAFRTGAFALNPDPSWKGRVVNALGEPIDGAGPIARGARAVPADAEPPVATRRARVRTPVRTGVRIIDLFCPLCAGQRIGIFAGSGVGKSTLLGMLARSLDFDTVVIGLVGERGREVREFLDDTLGENRAKAVTVVSTGDESPMMRRLAAKTAMAVAEFFRDAGESVLLVIDSVTRFAHASREIALAAGEPAVARGYAPSVFSDLPKLLERAGPAEEGGGSITGIFSVLVDGDDHNDPVADNIRGTLDGHIVLDRSIADQGRYPAVNVLRSVSRLAPNAWTADQRTLMQKLRGLISRYEETRDLRLMGGYQRGSDAELDQAVLLVPRLYASLAQDPQSPRSQDAFRELAEALQAADRPPGT
jgi:flagellum-specific ATP synthase